MQDLSTAFPSEGTTADLVVRADASPAGRGGRRAGRGRGRGREVAAVPPVRHARSQVSTDGTVSVLTLAMPFDESDDRVDTAIKELRSELAPAALDGLSGRGVRRRR